MKKVSTGSWTFSFGAYADNPVPWPELLRKLKSLGFDGVELGGFSIHPSPGNQPTKEARARIRQEAAEMGMGISAFAPNLWHEKLINTDNPENYLEASVACWSLLRTSGSRR